MVELDEPENGHQVDAQAPQLDSNIGSRSDDVSNRMDLSREELGWALEIKDMVEHTPELDNCSDFLYAQCAVVDRGDLEASVARILKLQEFRQEYNIVDDFENASRSMHRFFDLFPGWMLNFSFEPDEGSYSWVMDLNIFDLSTLKTNPEAESLLAKGSYHRGSMFTPDLEAARKGYIATIECQGHTLGKGLDIKYFRMMWEIFNAFPVRPQKARWFHCGVFSNLLLSSARRFMPQEVRSKFQVGLIAPQRLDTLFLNPTYKIAHQRNMDRIDESLRQRYKNIATFQLPDLPENRSARTRYVNGELGFVL